MTEKMPSSVMLGSRPRAWRTRSYSCGERPCSATTSGVIWLVMACRLGDPPRFVEGHFAATGDPGLFRKSRRDRMSVRPIPEGYQGVTPYLAVDDAAAAIRFYTEAFGAAETMRLEMGGKIGHAELRIAGGIVMLSDEWPDWNMLGPKSRGGPSCNLHLYVEDVDSAFAR